MSDSKAKRVKTVDNTAIACLLHAEFNERRSNITYHEVHTALDASDLLLGLASPKLLVRREAGHMLRKRVPVFAQHIGLRHDRIYSPLGFVLYTKHVQDFNTLIVVPEPEPKIKAAKPKTKATKPVATSDENPPATTPKPRKRTTKSVPAPVTV